MPKKVLITPPSPQDLILLEQLAENKNEDHRVVERAQIVLACLNLESPDEISARYQVSRSMIFRWRARFLKDGIAGLWDKPRSGKPTRYDEAFEKQVLEALSLPPPEGCLHWDGRALARYLGASDDAVWRVLRRHGVSLARQRVWTVNTRPPTGIAASRLAGLYIAPPVWMMAQRTIQTAADEARVYTRNRLAGNALLQAAGRSGKLPLQKALDIMAQFPQPNLSPNKRKEEMFNFLNDALESTLPHQQLTILVLGDAATLEISGWMMAHTNVNFFFYKNMTAAKSILDEHLPHMEENYSVLLRQVMAYPQDASPFIWKTIHREWMDANRTE